MPSAPPLQTYRVKSFGCQMNVYDGERMAELLAAQGLNAAAEGADADLVVLNTCHIREKAVDRVYSDIGRIVKDWGRDDGSVPLIAVAGCVAQAEGEEIMARAPSVRMVVGPQAYHRLPQMLAEAATGKRVTDTEMPAETKFAALPRRRRAGPSAFLTVQEGCDKFCTYCVVPYTRGAEVSRSFRELMTEAQQLLEGGAKEITLLGQNVNAWRGEDAKGHAIGLDGLIHALAALPDLARIRYTTSHPADMTDDLIAAHGEVAKLMPFLHLPIQSGANAVLKSMNRKHDADFYLEIISRLRKSRPDLALSSDFIVGFPGETERDFEETLELAKQVNYSQCYSFKYSPRPGTPGALMEDNISEEIKSARLLRLQELLFAQQLEFNQKTIGKIMPVLFDRKGKHEGQLLGKTEYMQSVHLSAASEFFGKTAPVLITRAQQNGLSGEIVHHKSTLAA